MAEIKVTKENFASEVLASEKPVVVDFWATWCGPCRMIAPVLEELAEKYEDKLTVGKVNVDEEMELAVKFSVASIPPLWYSRAAKWSQRPSAICLLKRSKAG